MRYSTESIMKMYNELGKLLPDLLSDDGKYALERLIYDSVGDNLAIEHIWDIRIKNIMREPFINICFICERSQEVCEIYFNIHTKNYNVYYNNFNKLGK